MSLEPLGEDDLDDLLPFVREYHAFEGVHMPDAARRAAVGRLLGDPALGAIWGIGVDSRRVGYIALTYGYSIEFRGRDAFIDEFFIREPWRRRGLGRAALDQVKARAAELGLKALHLEVARSNRPAQKLYRNLGFELRERFSLMSLKLDGESIPESSP